MTIDMAKHAESRIVMLCGTESYDRDDALSKLLQAVGVTSDDFDLEHFDADAAAPNAWLASVGTAPFLAERRTVIVRHMFRSDPTEVKPAQLQALPPSSLLILVFDDEVNLDPTTDKTKKCLSGWKKLIEGAKGSYCEFKADPKEAKAILKRACDAAGVSTSDGALNVLVEMCGGNSSHGRQELDKLFLYVGEAKTIRETDVRTVAIPSRDWNVFRMIDSIFSKRPSDALAQLRIMMGSPTKAEEAAFRSILPMTARQLRLFWQARICLDSRCSPTNVPGEILAFFPEKPNLASESPYRQTAIMSGARNATAAQITRCMEILSDTDGRLKGILFGFSAVETLETMVLQMCSALR